MPFIHMAATRHDALRPIAGWSSQVARRAHNPKVAGSNPAPAMSFGTTHRPLSPGGFVFKGVGVPFETMPTDSGMLLLMS